MIQALSLLGAGALIAMFIPMIVAESRERAAWRAVVLADRDRRARLEGTAANHPLGEGRAR